MRYLINELRLYLAVVLLDWAFSLAKDVPGPEALAILKGINQACLEAQKTASYQDRRHRK